MPTLFSPETAFHQGTLDRRRGVDREKCPKTTDIESVESWQRGWDWEDARQKHMKIAHDVVAEAHLVIQENDKSVTQERKSKRKSKGKTGH